MVQSSSVPNVTWMAITDSMSEVVLTISETIVEARALYSSVVTLNQSLPNYSGLYTCTATTNEDGESTGSGVLVVQSTMMLR